MRKKILGLLLVICLVVGLLPVVASAEANVSDATVKIGSTTHKLTAFDTPIYTVNTSKETQDTAGNKFTKWGQTTTGATEENYNMKFVWETGKDAPTLTLRGFKLDEWNNDAKLMEGKWNEDSQTYKGLQTYAITTSKEVPLNIILTGEDSLIEAKFGITFYNNLSIKSEGETKLTINCPSSGISSNKTEGATLTIDANLHVTTHSLYNTNFNAASIHTYMANLTINGGTIVSTTLETEKGINGIAARAGGDVIINGGNITAVSSTGAGATNGCITASAGKLIINGGTVNSNPKRAVGLYGKTGVEINGGNVNILTPYYGINAGTKEEPADILINGGTLKIISQYSFYKVPSVASKVFAFAGANEENAEVYDGTNTQMCKKPWWLSTDDESQKIETKPEETVPSITIPTTPEGGATPAPTQAATTPTESTADNDKGGDSGFNTDIILWAVIGVAVVAAVAVVVIILLKRKKA